MDHLGRMGWRPARGWAGQGGARAAQRVAKAHAGLDEQAFVRVAQQSRQRAHAEERSARLLLPFNILKFTHHFRHI